MKRVEIMKCVCIDKECIWSVGFHEAEKEFLLISSILLLFGR